MDALPATVPAWADCGPPGQALARDSRGSPVSTRLFRLDSSIGQPGATTLRYEPPGVRWLCTRRSRVTSPIAVSSKETTDGCPPLAVRCSVCRHSHVTRIPAD